MITSAITVVPVMPAIQAGSVVANGLTGPSAYQIAVSRGYAGTVDQWLASLVGPVGPAPDTAALNAATAAAAGSASDARAAVAALQAANLMPNTVPALQALVLALMNALPQSRDGLAVGSLYNDGGVPAVVQP